MKKNKNYKFGALTLNPLILIINGINCYYIYSLLKYGGVRRKLPVILTSTTILVIWFLWCIYRYRKQNKIYDNANYFKIWYFIALFILLSTTVIAGINIYKSGIPFNGKLSWFIHDLKNKREIAFIHNNIYDDGLEGLFKDIGKKANLPEELYISNRFQLEFDKNGEINNIYTYLYGRDHKEETRSFLISYNRDKSEDVTVYLNGYVNEDYNEEMKMQPFIDLMQWVSLKETVDRWDEEQYGILYAGVRNWGYNTDGIIYVKKNIDTGQVETWKTETPKDEILGYTLSVYVPSKEDIITPVRYIHHGFRVLSGKEDEQARQWNIGYSYKDGEETYFLNKNRGYQLSIVDAALGSRFYVLLHTKDSGHTWETINSDPFLNNTGVSSGITFINEELGFIGLSHSGGKYAELYRTEDGGISFKEVSIQEVEVLLNELETYNPFDFPEMPYQEDGKLFLLVGQGQDGDYNGGIKAMYESKDDGKTWEYIKEVN